MELCCLLAMILLGLECRNHSLQVDHLYLKLWYLTQTVYKHIPYLQWVLHIIIKKKKNYLVLERNRTG